jgi:hypothetical protein
MAKQVVRRRTPPRRVFIAPLVMLASGMAVGLVVWRFLMLEPARAPFGRWQTSEQLSREDRDALERVLGAHP